MTILLQGEMNASTLISQAALAQQNRKSRVKFSLLSNNIIVIGDPNSTKCIHIGEAKDNSKPSRSCLSVNCKVKETTPKFINLIETKNLDLIDMQGIVLRDAIATLNDCELKEVLIEFVSKYFRVPSKATLKRQLNKESPKVRYIRSAFKSSLKYANNTEFSNSIIELYEEYIPHLQKIVNDAKKKAQ